MHLPLSCSKHPLQALYGRSVRLQFAIKNAQLIAFSLN